ncbi:hypothetical protein TNCV_2331251 [Trichonephila clavipes]|nr:hypothetical protein TNCV_2331251 [Trichonephila clavipes]
MMVEITRLQLRSGMKCFLTGWEVSLSLAVASASVRTFQYVRAPSYGYHAPPGGSPHSLRATALNASSVRTLHTEEAFSAGKSPPGKTQFFLEGF